MNEVIRKNRECCKGKIWITEDEWKRSGDLYGLPDFCFSRINDTLTDDVTYSDVLVYLSNNFHIDEYLEIGVSVLKNFYQMASNTECNLIAYDINQKNPCVEIPREYKYIQGNVMVKDDWEPLKALNKKHNLIFSDALHSNEGLQAEWDNYILDHLADKFIIVWDDAWDSPVQHIKQNFIPELMKRYGEVYMRLETVQAWTPNERHPIFIVSNHKFNLGD